MSKKGIIVSISTAFILIWMVNAIFTATRAKVLDIAKPTISIIQTISQKTRTFLFPQNRLKKENRLLKEQLEIMKYKLVGLDELTQENIRLKRLLDFKKNIPYKTISAQVMGRDPSNWTSIIYIDKGKDNGIKKHMAVTTDKGLVGKVIEVGSTSAKVIFITDPDLRLGVLIERTRDDGLLYGALSRKCHMVYISLDADVWPGDKVVSSGVGSFVSKGLLVGTVEDVFIDKSGLYQTAIVKPAVDLSKVEEVLCIE